jgi:hypothetical protein
MKWLNSGKIFSSKRSLYLNLGVISFLMFSLAATTFLAQRSLEIRVPAQEKKEADSSLSFQKGTLKGTVTDSQTGSVISGAKISVNLYNQTGSQERAAVAFTDNDGGYRTDLEPDFYIIKAEAKGYTEKLQTATIRSNETTVVLFSLDSQSGNGMEEAIVEFYSPLIDFFRLGP